MIRPSRVYSIVLEDGKSRYLSLHYATSLDQALDMACNEFEASHVMRFGIPPSNYKMIMYCTKSVNELTDESKNNTSKILEKYKKFQKSPKVSDQKKLEPTVKKEKTESEKKNELMKSIIDNKDVETFKKNKKMFSKVEKMYILDRLK